MKPRLSTSLVRFVLSLFLFIYWGCQSSYRSEPIPLYHSIALDTNIARFQSQLNCLKDYDHDGVTLVILINDLQGLSKVPPRFLQYAIRTLKKHQIPYFLFFTSLHHDSLFQEFSGCDTFVFHYFEQVREYIGEVPKEYPPQGIVLGDRWYELEACDAQIIERVEQLKADFPNYRYSWLQGLHWWEKGEHSATYDFIALEYPNPPVRRPENAVPFLNEVIQRKLGSQKKPVWIGRVILLGKGAQAKWEKLQTRWDAHFPLIGVNLFTIFPYFNVCDTLSPLQLYAPWLKDDENSNHTP